jgi:ferrous iron transport protein B
MIMFKERSKKEAVTMWLSTWVIAFTVGGIINQLGQAFYGNILWMVMTFLAGAAGVIWITKKMTTAKRG